MAHMRYSGWCAGTGCGRWLWSGVRAYRIDRRWYCPECANALWKAVPEAPPPEPEEALF